MSTEMTAIPTFGKEIKKTEFTLKDGVVFVNHGSYGVVPTRVQQAQDRIIGEMRDHPDLWWRHNLRLSIEESRKCVAEFVQADTDDIVFLQNATSGICSVLRSLPFKSGDIILCTDNSYQSVKYASEFIRESSNGKGVLVEYLTLKFPINSENDVVELYREFFRNNQNVKLVIIDHITSPSAIVMPVNKLVELCREYGILSLIDGAHAPGQIPLNLRQLKADFYIGNLHKWLYTPKGCAILYIKKDHKDYIKPLAISHGYKKGILTDFFHQGTRDDSAYCVAPVAIQFFNDIGGHDKIQAYTDKLLCEAVKLLTDAWGTEKLAIPMSMEAPFMRIIKLPKLKVFAGLTTFDEVEPIIIDHLVNHNVSSQYTFVDGDICIRISANIYNSIEDYQKLANFICNLMQ
ncbi:uncharacterized protein LOC127729109 [Mytilus californianus]|uniref:uncharacterized protein LOC127729109 n=1 Tax=Mytilus californianus TaxID=6549 RepID=UPI002248008F|nr:uncharacterized protein LOC127729109 [Mytilus californianus]